MMEVYAGCLAYTDDNIGRVIQAVEETGELDNTLIIYLMGDNGASGEGTLQGLANEVGVAANGVEETLEYLKGIKDDLGGPLYYNHYPVGWAHAMDTPFQWTKQVASHFGGTANNLVISWPKRIKQMAGEVRSQFCHVIDIAPTILEAARVPAPTMINGVKQTPIEGTSLVYTFDDAKAATKHTTQYFEMLGNRAIYHDGWMASTTPLRMPWAPPGTEPSADPDDFQWELYHVAEDFSQAKNVAAENPDKLKKLQDIFDQEAKKYNVYPLDSSFAERADVSLRPSLTAGRNTFTYYPGDPGPVRIPEGATPDVKNKDFTITAEIGSIPDSKERRWPQRCARHAGRTVRRLGIAPKEVNRNLITRSPIRRSTSTVSVRGSPEKLAPGKPHHQVRLQIPWPRLLARAAPAHSPWTANKSRKAKSSTPSPPASRSTRRSTSAWTPVRPSSRTMWTRCRSSSRARSRRS